MKLITTPEGGHCFYFPCLDVDGYNLRNVAVVALVLHCCCGQRAQNSLVKRIVYAWSGQGSIKYIMCPWGLLCLLAPSPEIPARNRRRVLVICQNASFGPTYPKFNPKSRPRGLPCQVIVAAPDTPPPQNAFRYDI